MRCKVAWIRALHTFAYALHRILLAAGYYRIAVNVQGREYFELDLKRIPALRRIWPIIELFSMAPLIITRVKIPSLLGMTVVCERYTIDSIPSITYITENDEFHRSLPARILLAMQAPDYVGINLDCDYKTVSSRRGRDTEPEDFIDTQRTFYARVSARMNALKIDTSKHSLQETHEIILGYLASRNGFSAMSARVG